MKRLLVVVEESHSGDRTPTREQADVWLCMPVPTVASRAPAIPAPTASPHGPCLYVHPDHAELDTLAVGSFPNLTDCMEADNSGVASK